MNQDEEAQLTQELQRSTDAEIVLNNKEFKRAFEDYTNELINEIKRTKWEETNKREEIYRQLKSLGTVEAKLTRCIQTGKMAKQQLSLLKQAKNLIGD